MVKDTKIDIKRKNKTKNDNKINLKRGKFPSNWNAYIETSCSTSTNTRVLKKFPKNLSTLSNNNGTTKSALTKMGRSDAQSTSNYIGIDCEMVGVNENGRDNMLARVSLVDDHGTVVYDTFVKPTQRVIDHRTEVSGVRPADIINGRDFKTVQSEVHALLHDKVLVGHAVRNDLKVLFLKHHKKYIRDTSKFKKFREETKGRTPSLKFLSNKYLGMEIQTGEHSSVEDARATMLLYMKFRTTWEAELRTNKYKR